MWVKITMRREWNFKFCFNLGNDKCNGKCSRGRSSFSASWPRPAQLAPAPALATTCASAVAPNHKVCTAPAMPTLPLDYRPCISRILVGTKTDAAAVWMRSLTSILPFQLHLLLQSGPNGSRMPRPCPWQQVFQFFVSARTIKRHHHHTHLSWQCVAHVVVVLTQSMSTLAFGIGCCLRAGDFITGGLRSMGVACAKEQEMMEAAKKKK